MSDRVNVLFPIEGIDRELDFRLVLAGMCANPGNRVVIAQHDLLHEHVGRIQGGVYVGKNVFRTLFPTDLGRYRTLRNRGVSLVHLDEEGLVASGEDQDVWRRAFARRLDASCLASGDRVCAWGRWQRDYYRSTAPDVGSAIVATGHPRFELCKPLYRSYFARDHNDLRRRFGRFVLVNTSFGSANSAYGIKHIFSASHGYESRHAIRDHYVRKWLHELRLVGHFIGLIYRLSLELPDEHLVVRPHPVEDLTLYQAIFRDSPNVTVAREGSVTPWLLACDAMVHERCTTGIEAALAGTPIINYEPTAEETTAMYVPGLLGVKARTEDEVISALQTALAAGRREFVLDDVTRLGRDLLANFEHDALVGVSAVIDEAETQQRSATQALDEKGLTRLVARSRIIDTAKRPIRPMFKEKTRTHAANRQVFYGFKAEEIASKLAAVEQLTRKRLKYRQHGDAAIVIETAD
jgi:surface carbohydrate biosynthesis protein